MSGLNSEEDGVTGQGAQARSEGESLTWRLSSTGVFSNVSVSMSKRQMLHCVAGEEGSLNEVLNTYEASLGPRMALPGLQAAVTVEPL